MIDDVGQQVFDRRAQDAGMAAVFGSAHKLGRLTGPRLGEAGGVRSAGVGGAPPQSGAGAHIWVARALLEISGACWAGAPASSTLQGMAGKFFVAITGLGWGLGSRPKITASGQSGRAGVRAQAGLGLLLTAFAGGGG